MSVSVTLASQHITFLTSVYGTCLWNRNVIGDRKEGEWALLLSPSCFTLWEIGDRCHSLDLGESWIHGHADAAVLRFMLYSHCLESLNNLHTRDSAYPLSRSTWASVAILVVVSGSFWPCESALGLQSYFGNMYNLFSNQRSKQIIIF